MKIKACAFASYLMFSVVSSLLLGPCRESPVIEATSAGDASVSPSESCDGTREEPSAEEGSVLPELAFPSQETDSLTREARLWLKVSAIMRSYRIQAEQYCVLNGRAVAGVADRNCVRLALLPLIDRSNVQKIMSAIGARPDEYDWVHSLIVDFANRGF